MTNTRKLWTALAVLLVCSFSVLLWAGGEIVRAAYARESTDARWGDHLYPRRYRAKSPGLAVNGRHATRLNLGPRRVRRARLERGLVAP